MKRQLYYVLTALLLLYTGTASAQITCQQGGNLWVYANYDGGILNINVDVNLPNIKIGVCTYEPVTINITGAYAANVTEVRYAGYVSTNNNHCTGSPTTTTINAPGGASTSVNFLPPSTLSNPNGYSSIVCAYTCSTNSNQGGCNTADQIKAYFQSSMNATLVSYETQYGCWPNGGYSLSQGGSCCSSVTACAVTANAGNDAIVCPGNSVQLNGSVVGATTYSWSPSAGLSNPNILNPVATPTTTTAYVLTASDGGICIDTDTVIITRANPSVSFQPLPGICADDAPVALTGANPPGGIWSGAGVNNNMFDPALAGVGTITLTYSAVDANGCNAMGNTTIEVNPLPTVTLSALPGICTDDPSFIPTNGSPAGGVYAGPGIANGEFFPSVAGPGTHTLQYAYTDANGCSNIASTTVTVTQTPAVPTLSVGGSDSLYSSVVGSSYTWLLNGSPVATTTSQPYIATQNGIYAVIVNNGNCVSDTSASVMVEIVAITLPSGQVIQAWPNPAHDYLHIAAGNAQVTVSLFDLAGKQVRADQLVNSNGVLSLQGLPSGVYLLQVQLDGRVGSMRIVKH